MQFHDHFAPDHSYCYPGDPGHGYPVPPCYPVGYPAQGEFATTGQFNLGSYATIGKMWPPVASVPAGTRPLKVAHLTAHIVTAGIESWLLGLLRNFNPYRVQLTKCIVANPKLSQRDARPFPVPVEVGGDELVVRTCRECDVLLISDPGEVTAVIAQHRPKLTLLVAHGDGYWTRAFIERAAPVVDMYVAVSERVRNMTCQGYRSTVIMNGVDETRLSRSRSREEVRKSLGFQPEDFVLGYVGRFSEEKNPYSAIETVARLPARYKALLVGYGPLRGPMLERANALIPGRYTFISAERYLGDMYAAMDAFSLTSGSEGYGLAIMEAMMCGLPVIVSPIGFVTDGIEHRINGIVVPGDPDSVAEAVRLLDAHPDWAASLGREAARFADRYGFASRMARQYEDLICGLWQDKVSVAPVETPW